MGPFMFFERRHPFPEFLMVGREGGEAVFRGKVRPKIGEQPRSPIGGRLRLR
jgi:hypothetical protein